MCSVFVGYVSLILLDEQLCSVFKDPKFENSLFFSSFYKFDFLKPVIHSKAKYFCQFNLVFIIGFIWYIWEKSFMHKYYGVLFFFNGKLLIKLQLMNLVLFWSYNFRILKYWHLCCDLLSLAMYSKLLILKITSDYEIIKHLKNRTMKIIW